MHEHGKSDRPIVPTIENAPDPRKAETFDLLGFKHI